MCKETLQSLLRCVSGEETTSSVAGTSKRKHDNLESTQPTEAKKKKQNNTGIICQFGLWWCYGANMPTLRRFSDIWTNEMWL